jgi:hypothetical protein
MKEVIKPQQYEQAEFFCDFKGKSERAYNFIKIRGGYGSDFDLDEYTFELSNEAVAKLLEFIANNLQPGDSLENHCTDYNMYDM